MALFFADHFPLLHSYFRVKSTLKMLGCFMGYILKPKGWVCPHLAQTWVETQHQIKASAENK